MTKLSSEAEAEILRLAFVELWPVGSIATSLGVHRTTVTRVIQQAEHLATPRLFKEKITDEYVSFVQDMLIRYPDVRASRLFQMAKLRGYKGTSTGHFRRLVKELRPASTPEAFLRLSTLCGEEGQVDWAEFGKVDVHGTLRKLIGFVMTLSWSRAVFIRFFFSAKTAVFQEGFVHAFEFFGGVPKRVLHDNLKTGVIERQGSLVRFNEDFLALCKHYLFEPCAVNVRRGNEKGRVERSIRFVRDNFYAARPWTTLNDLNTQAAHWCVTESFARAWRRGDSKTVGEAFEIEKASLVALPAVGFPALEHTTARIGKTPYARFDTNDYSVPARCVGKTLSVAASHDTVTFSLGIEKIAEHPRSWHKHQTLINPEHTAEIRAQKPRAKTPSGLARLTASVPHAGDLVERMALHGQNLGGAISSLLKLLDLHGAERLSQAITEVNEAQSYRLAAVHFILRRLDVPTGKELPNISTLALEKYGRHNVAVQSLSTYDKEKSSDTP